MHKIGIIREFKTQNFHVIVDAVEEEYPDLSWADEETLHELEIGSLVNFTARARVFVRGLEVSSDYLGGCVYKSLDDFQDHRECAAYTRKLHKREGKFNIYRGPAKDGALLKKDRLKPRGFATRERAEEWAKAHVKEEYHIVGPAVCGSYFADMVRTAISEARKEVASMKDVRIRQEVS